jgi:two-component system, NtrC family, nitrogen regulation response regulator GlnG
MSTDHLESTVEPSRGRERARIFRVPALTIAYHPRPDRIGEVARLLEVLEGRDAGISRLAPEFAQPFAAERAPLGPGGGTALGDRRLSRTPVAVSLAPGGGVVLRPGGGPCRVDGTPLDRERTISAAALQRGVTVELADRVVLLLHTLGLPAPRQPRLGMDGESEALERLRAEVLRVAPLPVPVLVRGESGAGKELVARALAQAGPRAAASFVAVNLAAIPPTLAASELFGHAPGAFTGAEGRHEGHFARADGGTLFLDEVAAAPIEVQGALLRILETREVQPLGSGRATRVDVRVVSATDGDLELAVREGAFRDALYHRLAGYQLAVPPLRERRDDVARHLFALLREGLTAAGATNRLEALDAAEPWLPASLVARLVRYDWPGNVRELANVARRLVVAGRAGAPAEEAVPPELLRDTSEPPAGPAPASRPAAPVGGAALLDEETVLAALRAHRFRVGATARALGVSRTTLYARLDASERIRKAKDVPEDELRRAFADLDGDAERMAERLEVSSRGILLRLRDLGLA